MLKGNLVMFIKLYKQTNNGGEFKPFTSYLNQHDTTHCVTYPYTSEQNGIIERKHRHIVYMGLTLMYQASMSMEY